MSNKPSNTKVILQNVRLSYVALLEPKAIQEGQDPKYSCMILIPKDDTANLKRIERAIDAAFEAGKSGHLKGVKRDRLKITLRDADEELDLEANPEFEDHMFMNVNSANKPGLLNKYKEKTDSQDDIYSGVFAHVSLNFYAYNTAGNRGVTAGLNNVLSLGRGDYLGGRASADSDFADFEVEDDYDEDLADLV